MSTSDDFTLGQRGEHVVEELSALVGGELDVDVTRQVTAHLHACAFCRDELVEVAAGIGLMRRLDALPKVAAPPATPPPAPAASPAVKPRSRTRLLVAIAAAVLILVGGVLTTTLLLTNRGAGRPQAKVALTPPSDGSAAGSVAMRSSGSAQSMTVSTSLRTAPRDQYYEVWLLDRATGKMLPVGVLAPDGRATFRLPADILKGYNTVDISLQPNDGSTQHSSDSVLRASYA